METIKFHAKTQIRIRCSYGGQVTQRRNALFLVLERCHRGVPVFFIGNTEDHIPFAALVFQGELNAETLHGAGRRQEVEVDSGTCFLCGIFVLAVDDYRTGGFRSYDGVLYL